MMALRIAQLLAALLSLGLPTLVGAQDAGAGRDVGLDAGADAVDVPDGGAPQSAAPPADAVPSRPGPQPEEVPAADACGSDRFVVLTVASDVDEAFAREVRADLAAELGQRGLALCTAGSNAGAPAAARVKLGVDAAVALIELDDRLTHKRVARDLSLSAIPASGRALATAIAIDELLRASWAELTLGRAQREPRPEQPVESERAQPAAPAEPAAEPPVPTRAVKRGLALGFGYTRTLEDYQAFSLGARATLRPGFGWLVLAAGPIASLPATTPLGDVRALGVGATITVGACAAGRGRMRACVGARTGVDWLRFQGRNAHMAEGRREQAVVAHLSGVAHLAGAIGRGLYLFGELGLGGPLRGVRATDGERGLVGITGMMLSLQGGLGWEL